MSLNPKYKVSLLEENDQHFYMVENIGVKLPGVTGTLNQVSKQALPAWTAREVAEYMRIKIEQLVLHPDHRTTPKFLDLLVKRAKKQGTIVRNKAGGEGRKAHHLFDQAIQNNEFDSDETIFRSFKFWRSQEPLKIIQGDTKIASLRHGYGGSLDALAEDSSGNLWVIDFKTGKRIYDTHAYQVAAYSYAAFETFDLPAFPRGLVVRFNPKKVSFERREILDVHESFRCFRAALELQKGQQISHFDISEKMKMEVA